MFGHLTRMRPGCIPLEVFHACPTEEAPEKTQNLLEGSSGLVVYLLWPENTLGSPRTSSVTGEIDVWVSFLDLLHLQPNYGDVVEDGDRANKRGLRLCHG